jgi:vancomycin resistance protein VanJ
VQTEPPANPPAHTPVDRLLDALVRAVESRRDPQGIVQRVLRWIRAGLGWISWGYLAGLAVVLGLLEWHGERHWVLSFLLYLPPTGWLLPFLFLTPLCVLFRPRLCFAHLLCAVLVLGIFMSPRWSRWPAPRGPTIKILTNNRGEANQTSPTQYIEAQRPDVVALQEAGREVAYQQAYPGWHVKAVGEFTLLSRFPIRRAEPLDLKLQGLPVGARFELDCDGRPLVVYNIHIISPRRDLDQLRGLGFPALLLAPAKTRYGEARAKYQSNWAARRETARLLAERVAGETLPVVAAGDFNFPDHGYAYHLFADRFTDCFAARGRGYGLTVPGITRNPLSIFGPWLRLDYLWTGPALRPIHCEREPGRASLHRSVVATLEWVEE